MILASNSPRRAEILSMLGYDFSIVSADCDENCDGLSVKDSVAELAKRKAQSVLQRYPHEVVLGSDTLVTIDGKPLGKPVDEADAKRMLSMLSGRSHTVYTGVSIVCSEGDETFVSATEVEFYPLSDDDIQRYIDSGEPFDKAGAYGIQGKGSVLIKSISGDFFSVMGLPAAETARRLKKYGIYPQK